jgi:glycosyltransferase involved in cell wall biosynthesis
METLILAPLVPHAPVDGDRLRLWHWIKQLHRRGHRLTLACFAQHRRDLDAARTAELRKMLAGGLHAVLIHPWKLYANAGLSLLSRRPLNVAAYDSAAMQRLVRRLDRERGFDRALAYRLRMAPFAGGLRCPKALDFCDPLAGYAAQRAAAADEPVAAWRWRREARLLSAFEPEAARGFDACFANASGDARGLQAAAPDARVLTLPNGVDFHYHHPSPLRRDPDAIVFVGHLAYAPNWKAVLEFHRRAFPLIVKRRPTAKLWVVGGGAPAGLVRELFPDRRVVLAGFVEDVRPWVSSASVALCTVSLGAGRQNKLLEAFAVKTPAVASPQAADAAGARDRRELRVADRPEAVADACLELMAKPSLARRQAAAAFRFVHAHYSWDASGALLAKTLTRLNKLKRDR